MAQRIEQGSVLGFVLVGAVLLGLLAGGIYVVRHMQSTSNTTTTKPATPSNNNTADNGSSAPAKPSTSNEDQLKAALDAQSKSKEEAKKSDASGSGSSSTSATDSSSSAAALPKTGPEQIVGPMLGAAFLVASLVSYTRSRRLI